ncbi:MAG TPA: dihydropteroate synthase [Gaiellales bacterium]|nr:dihydropteroate synthase [Gaiellales bacterium]
MSLAFASRALSGAGPPLVMGIVNVTPDSFYDGGTTAAPGAAIDRGLALLDAGASIVDVGGMTARPGRELTVDDELARVLPVLTGLRARTEAVLSVDTYRAAVAGPALDAGADLVNDHTGLSDPRMADTVAARDAGIVVTHLGVAPKQVQGGRYRIPAARIAAALAERAAAARAAGIRKDAILLDPGLGFGKDTASDLDTLRDLPSLTGLGYPLLLACSHKEVTAEPLGLPEASLEGTAAVVAVAAFLGVRVLRLHDLPFMERVARMAWLMRAEVDKRHPGSDPGFPR